MFHEDVVNIGKANYYSKGWKGKYTSTAGELKEIVSKYASSPCLWAGGIRLKRNFRCAEWMGLDFDEGMTLDDAVKIFDKYMHLIGTTKSHGIIKNGVKQDRFRVFLRLQDRCLKLEDYEETVRSFTKKHGADSACVDGARYFWPCKEIISLKCHGEIVKVIDSGKKSQNLKRFNERRKKNWDILYKPGKTIPPRVMRKLKFGVPEGTRNINCFQIGADLRDVGFCLDEIVDLIMRSSIPLSADSKTRGEVKKAVISGMNKAERE